MDQFNEYQRVGQLPKSLRPQAKKHLEQCEQGADRMDEGVISIRNDVRRPLGISAFPRSYAPAVWLAAWWESACLAPVPARIPTSRAWRRLPIGLTQEERSWICFGSPTGGGKTEAYLALTAFVILLRRLRSTDKDPGTGVAVTDAVHAAAADHSAVSAGGGRNPRVRVSSP